MKISLHFNKKFPLWITRNFRQEHLNFHRTFKKSFRIVWAQTLTASERLYLRNHTYYTWFLEQVETDFIYIFQISRAPETIWKMHSVFSIKFTVTKYPWKPIYSNIHSWYWRNCRWPSGVGTYKSFWQFS